ncbi:MAG: hypothetical protein AAF383_04990 [Cyanobacteria bacterium P01_A01_bin.83]
MATASKAKDNAEGWKLLFDGLHLKESLENDGHVTLTAEEIKEISGREPRLMCKFDSKDSRPQILKQNNCTILPIQNGVYKIVSGDGYASTNSQDCPIEKFDPSRLHKFQTLPSAFRSESQVIDAAHASGLLSSFLGDNDLILTIRGRLRSPRFGFSFQSTKGLLPIEVQGVQIEVDSGFEGDAVYLVEAKMGDREDFHLRQIYYPYRMWRETITNKPIKPVFLTYSNGIFALYLYSFAEDTNYHSVRLDKVRKFTFEQNPSQITLREIIDEITPHRQEPTNFPFPQADNILKVRDTIDLIASGFTTRDSLAEYWTIDSRQGDYYANAAAFLGFVERSNGEWKLTNEGFNFRNSAPSVRSIQLAQSLFAHPVFHKAMKIYFETNDYPSKEQVGEIIQEFTTLKGTTPTRRARTVLAWLKALKLSFEQEILAPQ